MCARAAEVPDARAWGYPTIDKSIHKNMLQVRGCDEAAALLHSPRASLLGIWGGGGKNSKRRIQRIILSTIFSNSNTINRKQ